MNEANVKYQALLEKYFCQEVEQELFDKESIKLKNKIQEYENTLTIIDNIDKQSKIIEIKFNRFLNDIKNCSVDDELNLIRQMISNVYVENILSPVNFEITIQYKFEV